MYNVVDVFSDVEDDVVWWQGGGLWKRWDFYLMVFGGVLSEDFFKVYI